MLIERNIVDAQLRKQARYEHLKTNLKLAGWKVYDRTWEIGSLGFISKSTDSFLRTLGFSNNQRKYIRKRLSKMALRSSYYIWMSRHNMHFLPPTLIHYPPPATIRAHPPPHPKVMKQRKTPIMSIFASLPPVHTPNPHTHTHHHRVIFQTFRKLVHMIYTIY